jgi:hypothetical protein
MHEAIYRGLADGVLVLHLSVVLFVVVGLVLTLLGGWCRWSWVGNRWFRGVHLLTIAVIVLQSWLGVVCPLTDLEMWLRIRGGQQAYNETFIAHWLGRVLWVAAPGWVFAVAYTGFGALVAWTLWAIPVCWRPGIVEPPVPSRA